MKLFKKFPIIRNLSEVQEYFAQCDKKFTVGRQPYLRKNFWINLLIWAEIFELTISPTR